MTYIPLRENVIEPFSFVNSDNNTGWNVPLLSQQVRPGLRGVRIRAELI
jgi:hypothetical protein